MTTERVPAVPGAARAGPAKGLSALLTPPCLQEQGGCRPGKVPASPLELIATSAQLLRYATATSPLQAR